MRTAVKYIIAAWAFVAGFALSGLAWAQTAPSADPDTVNAVGNAAHVAQVNMTAIGLVVLPFAALILALFLGWRYGRKFLRA